MAGLKVLHVVRTLHVVVYMSLPSTAERLNGIEFTLLGSKPEESHTYNDVQCNRETTALPPLPPNPPSGCCKT